MFDTIKFFKLAPIKFKLNLFKMAILRRLKIDLLPDSGNLNRLIISPGGVATTTLINYVDTFLTINCANDTDGLKHLPYLPERFKNAQIVFVTGRPEEICASLYRRNFHTIQAAKLGCPLCQLLTWRPMQRRLIIGAIQSQLRNFKKLNHGQILFVEYDDMWRDKHKIALHLGIEPDEFCRNFPTKKGRKSQLVEINRG